MLPCRSPDCGLTHTSRMLCLNHVPADIVDIKPANMEELTEVITAAEFHPHQCNVFVYSSSKGTIRLCDMRSSALCDRHSKCKCLRVGSGSLRPSCFPMLRCLQRPTGVFSDAHVLLAVGHGREVDPGRSCGPGTCRGGPSVGFWAGATSRMLPLPLH